ncbi:ankyrin repeat domain-containing protein [Gimesia aquarii]|uniref:Ankyrin repeats (3 copies) n=1 Tax=Gimesia aquarii TaxID=2527964 RepID=A0A517VSH3_9PLAN|nr:ankyrin repeat domain-containing protein [Gimesia aquarii]QDT95920.1 Ankyrin repeats (3 copies) [Gimesia aquarii]
MIRRMLKYCSVCTALLLTIILITYATLPTPASPPLQGKSGVRLDAQSEAALIKVVFQAARDNDMKTISEYLLEGFTPNVRSERGDTLLTVAAYHGSDRVIATLLTHQEIEIEARNRMGLTAVSAAAFKGHDVALRQLLDAGASPTAANTVNQSAIMFAALAGRTSTVQILRDAGASDSRTDDFGNSADSLARSQGTPETMSHVSSSSPEYQSDAPVPLELSGDERWIDIPYVQ